MTENGHRYFAAMYDRLGQSSERRWLGARRAALVGGLAGVVLDVGAGTGANLPYYRAATRVVAAEPDPAMGRRLRVRAEQARVPVELCDAGAESLPFPDAHFDAVVSTLVLCTVTDPDRALAEIRRVLRPSGRLAVIEHVRGIGRLARRQDRLTPLWTRFAAGCHPNRDTATAIEKAGFDVRGLEAFQTRPAWSPTSPIIAGTAVRRT